MAKFYKVDIGGKQVDLPIVDIGNNIKIAFLNLHGAQELTEHCAKCLAPLVDGADVILTAESKGLQLAHCVARELAQPNYAVARKSKKLYMDGITATVQSITTKNQQTLYLSYNDVGLLKGKKVAIVDDVISTGGSVQGMEKLVEMSGGIVYKKAFVLAEGDATLRDDIVFLASIPLL